MPSCSPRLQAARSSARGAAPSCGRPCYAPGWTKSPSMDFGTALSRSWSPRAVTYARSPSGLGTTALRLRLRGTAACLRTTLTPRLIGSMHFLGPLRRPPISSFSPLRPELRAVAVCSPVYRWQDASGCTRTRSIVGSLLYFAAVPPADFHAMVVSAAWAMGCECWRSARAAGGATSIQPGSPSSAPMASNRPAVDEPVPRSARAI